MKYLLLIIISFLLIALPAKAKVVKVIITSQERLEISPDHSHVGAYEIIKGIIYLEVDPNDPANEQIVDLKLAPLNSNGMVEFSTEFELHKPVNAQRGNHRLMYFVNNRGSKMGHRAFNVYTEMNWLYSKGWSYLWCGWVPDVPEHDHRLNIKVPIATKNGKTITGKTYSEIISFYNEVVPSLPIVWGNSIAYEPISLENSHAVLTKRQYRHSEPISIPNDGWKFAREEEGKVIPDPEYLYIKEGYTPGWLYDLVYVAKNPKVTGLGMAAIRDVVSYFKYEQVDEFGNIIPMANIIEYTYAWGHSQSARLLNHFVYENFNGDEKERLVFDGIMSNCPGGGKGEFNRRFAQFTRHGSHHEDHLYYVDVFPFTTVEQFDPITGKHGDAFAKARKSGFLPKFFYINSSTDYWTRGASLLHTDVEGKQDIEIDPNARIYLTSSLSHQDDDRTSFSTRALLTALDEWVTFGTEPPKSLIPKISDGTLVSLENYNKVLWSVPEFITTESYYAPERLDFGKNWETERIASNFPPKSGQPYVTLIPQVDEYGHEIAGIRLPFVEVPLQTFVGWSARNPDYSHTIRRNAGQIIPLAKTKEERTRNGDPRLSILERYPTKASYIMAVTKSLVSLKSKRLILDEDIPIILQEAAEQTYWPLTSDIQKVSVKEVSMNPEEFKVGEPLLLKIVFEGDTKLISKVKANFREANNFFFMLNDDGVEGDEIANDGIWSYAFQFYERQGWSPGEFHYDFYPINKNLEPIYLTGTVTNGVGNIGVASFTIK